MSERTYGGLTWEEVKGHALPLDMPYDDLWELMRLLCQGAFCSYCGEDFLYDDHIKSFLVMQEHIKTCPKHPLSAALARIAELEAVAEVAVKYYHTSEALDVTECDCADCDEARYELGQEKLRTALVLDAAFLAAGYLEKKT